LGELWTYTEVVGVCWKLSAYGSYQHKEVDSIWKLTACEVISIGNMWEFIEGTCGSYQLTLRQLWCSHRRSCIHRKVTKMY